MRRPAARALGLVVALLALAVLAGCGSTTEERDRAIVVTSPDTATGGTADGAAGSGIRIVMVTHGQASSPFWAIVRNGAESAARQMDVGLDYEAPDVYSVPRMTQMIDRAIAAHPDGLVISLPEPALAPAVRRAVRSGIPVVTINSGSDMALRLGVLAHVGQPEDLAGERAGRRLADAGARRVLCVNQQVGNQGLDARCAGLARALRRVHGRSWVLSVDDQSPQTPQRIAAAVRARGADGVLTLNATSGMEAVQGLRGRHVRIGVFDLGPDVLRAVRAGQVDFAVDQQAYLQGYLPVVFLAQRARYGLFPAQHDVIPTGPNFVTRENAEQAIELSARSIR
jgi:simple sugar transport system substrate-binding protein